MIMETYLEDLLLHLKIEFFQKIQHNISSCCQCFNKQASRSSSFIKGIKVILWKIENKIWFFKKNNYN